MQISVHVGNSNWKGTLSAVDLHVLTSSDQLILLLKILFTLVLKQSTLMRRSTVLSLPLQFVFPGSASSTWQLGTATLWTSPPSTWCRFSKLFLHLHWYSDQEYLPWKVFSTLPNTYTSTQCQRPAQLKPPMVPGFTYKHWTIRKRLYIKYRFLPLVQMTLQTNKPRCWPLERSIGEVWYL